jgi:DNA primase
MKLKESKLGMRYWNNRGYNEADAEYFEVRYNEDDSRLVFPVYDKLKNYVFNIQRSIFNVDRKYLIEGASKKSTVVYNLYNCMSAEELWIVEGCFDVFGLHSQEGSCYLWKRDFRDTI